MKLPLPFRRARTVLKRPDAQDRVEKLLANSLRKFGQACAKIADLIEAKRLGRQGYTQQHDFLRRLDQEQGPQQGPKQK
jgi:hypothetical protein